MQEYALAVEEDTVSNNACHFDQQDYEDIRIIVKIDVYVGTLYLLDQFEWPLFSTLVTPEAFAHIYCSELGVGGEFMPMIAHAIREQVVQARINFVESESPPSWNDRPLRTEDEDEWSPALRTLSGEEIQAMLKEQDRNSRYIF